MWLAPRGRHAAEKADNRICNAASRLAIASPVETSLDKTPYCSGKYLIDKEWSELSSYLCRMSEEIVEVGYSPEADGVFPSVNTLSLCFEAFAEHIEYE